MGKKTSLRRVPRQERGQRRLDKLLDAADQVFAKVGYEAATTNAIARQARTSIGSLYQFFPNKEALLKALAERYLGQLRAVHNAALEEAAGMPLPALYDRIIGALADFHAAHPGFQHLFFGSTASPHLAAAARQLAEECVGRVDALMALRDPGLDPERRRLYAVMNVEVIKALLPLAQSAGPERRARVLAEIKNLLLAHARQVFSPAGWEGLPK